MELSAAAAEVIACAVLISVSLFGNVLLICCTWRCIIQRLPTSFALIFSLATAHLAQNLVVNVLNIVLRAVVLPFGSAACKIGRFTASLTTVIAIWFTLYLAMFYCLKLKRVVHPLSSSPNRKWRKHQMCFVFVLWIAGIAVCCPILVFAERKASTWVENGTHQNYILLHDGCHVDYGQEQIELIYGQIFMVVIDLLPLAVFILVALRITQLLWERKKENYGNIYIGEDAMEYEVVRASWIAIVLMFLVSALWVARFIILYYLEDLKSYPYIPTVQVVLFSGYSALSPYLLLLINYKVTIKLRSMRPFCCPNTKRPIQPSVEKPKPEIALVEPCPCS